MVTEVLSVPVIVGSGVAGLVTALRLPGSVVVTKGAVGDGSTGHAQGGIAAAVGPDDSPAAHASDTLSVGGGLVLDDVAAEVVGAAPRMVEWLQAIGTRFDRSADGRLDLGREAGHNADRILHADGDATGRELIRALRAAVAARPDITVLEQTEVIDLATSAGSVVGVVTRSTDGIDRVLVAPAVVLATGGIGGLFDRTTNPPGVNGGGLAVAARAGALLGDLEFVQFHPTALVVDQDPLPLLTEALRGAGAVLRDADGRRFMTDVHPDAELAPRDIVARAVYAEAARGGAFLDTATIDADPAQRFPTVFALARAAGIDPAEGPLRITPAAHYHMGGIVTDIDGRSSLPGLYACGEVATTGLHGANRLASNSLLEGMVFADRVASAIRRSPGLMQPDEVRVPHAPMPGTADRSAVTRLRDAMWHGVGVVRDGDGLRRASGEIEAVTPSLAATVEGRNLAIVAGLVTHAALDRTESRGSHYRSDHPHRRGLPSSRTRLTAAKGRVVSVGRRGRRHVA